MMRLRHMSMRGPRLLSSMALEPVVKIYSTVAGSNYCQPWQRKPPEEKSGSGFVLSKRERHILTNAHVVADQCVVHIRCHGDAHRHEARVLSVAHHADLALLTVDDPGFWASVAGELPLTASLPALHEEVSVVGYPTGGDNISVTRGVVSRVDLQTYAHAGPASRSALAIQIDAAINPGNSGGPAVHPGTGQVIGMAFQALANSENIGFIIPTPTIQHFLEEADHPRGFCSLGIEVQTLENPGLRRSLAMAAGLSGVRVAKVQALTRSMLEVDDVIVRVAGVPIANDGTIEYRPRERISFRYLLLDRHAGDTLRITVLRQGKELDLDVVMEPATSHWLVPQFEYDRMPSYLIYGGLVFMPLTVPFLYEWGRSWMVNAPPKLVELAMHGEQSVPQQQVLVLAHILPHSVNVGYEYLTNLRLRKVNGQPVDTMEQLTAMTHSKTPEDMVFEFDNGQRVVFKHSEATQASAEILQRHRIPADRSEDL